MLPGYTPSSTQHPEHRCTRTEHAVTVPQPCPGLNGPVSLRASSTQRTVVLFQLLYLRQFQPGTQRLSQGTWDKCWIEPGSRWIGSWAPFGPEMDCIWLPLSPFWPCLTLFWTHPDPVLDPSGHPWSKGSDFEKRDENHEKPAMRGPFLMNTPSNPENTENSRNEALLRTDRTRLV